MKLRKFKGSDWDCYAGCDSPYPKISELDTHIHTCSQESTEIFDGDAILDGKTVCFHAIRERTTTINGMEDTTPDEIIFRKEFTGDGGDAEVAAHMFLESCPNTVRAHELLGWGFSVTVN